MRMPSASIFAHLTRAPSQCVGTQVTSLVVSGCLFLQNRIIVGPKVRGVAIGYSVKSNMCTFNMLDTKFIGNFAGDDGTVLCSCTFVSALHPTAHDAGHLTRRDSKRTRASYSRATALT